MIEITGVVEELRAQQREADAKTDPTRVHPYGALNALTVDERRAMGRALRQDVPRSSHGVWTPPPDRLDPTTTIESQNSDRIEWLVPVRRGRMSVSPFTFYRGAAKIMAGDLSGTPSTGLKVQVCGDAHLSNFGVFASPERRLLFDVNDFDETLSGPWEWDVKRLAASLMIAAQHRGFKAAVQRSVTAASVRGYREAMAEFADSLTLDTWYAHVDVDELRSLREAQESKKEQKQYQHREAKIRSKNSLQALSKLAVEVDGRYRIRSDPPLLLPLSELPASYDPDTMREQVHTAFDQYRASLEDSRAALLDRFRPIDVAVKVVGVGSVGTRCLIMLLQGRGPDDPLFLQIKQAGRSVLEEFLDPSPYDNQGQRVVAGQRTIQAASDAFLGWARTGGHDYYWRQLRDGKASADIDAADQAQLANYAKLCGWTLAHAHARSGDAVAIAGYLGSGTVFDDAIVDFSAAYAVPEPRRLPGVQERRSTTATWRPTPSTEAVPAGPLTGRSRHPPTPRRHR